MNDEEVLKRNELLAKSRKYTVEEVEAMPEDVHVELIDGVLYYTAIPSRKHEELLTFLETEIFTYIKNKGESYKVYRGPLPLYLNQNKETYLLPDLLVVFDRSKIKDKGIVGGPDIVMEIVSPSSRRRDYILKQNKYQREGVREYWILDPKEDVIIVHRFETGIVEIHSFHAAIPVEILDGLEIDFAEFDIM